MVQIHAPLRIKKTKYQHSLLIFRLSNFSKNVKEPFIGSFIFKIYPPPAQISEYRPKSAYRTFCVGFLVSVVPCLCVVQIAVIGQNKQNLNHNAWKQKISRHNSPNCSETMSWDMTKVGLKGFEPSTFCTGNRCSHPLSYRPIASCLLYTSPSPRD